jgi:phosphoribosylglycinamide formyltransferase-1
MKPLLLLLLASGRGSHAVNVIEATRDGRILGSVTRLVSDRPDAPVLESARARGVPTEVLEPVHPGARLAPEAEARLLEIVGEDAPDLIALCGFMRLLRKSFLDRVAAPILNVHPSLLPAFPGLEPQRQAVEAGATRTGVTVHRVDAGMDTGPIVAQADTKILPGETAEALAERLLPIEHRLYVEAIQRIQREKT